MSILADAPAAATTATEKQVKETGTAKSEGASEEEKSADDEKNTSEQSDEESAPETETTEKKEETTEATTEDKEDATTEATTKAKEETTEATETSDKDQTTGAEDDSDKKDKTSETSEEETDKEKTTEAKDETAPSELTYTNDDVVITVSEVAEGAIPEDAELKVVPILKDDADTKTQYAEVEEKIQEKAAETETEIKGFLAYDITFVDEEGNEIEPNSEVKVSIEYKQAAIPAELSEEDAKNTEVSVMHLEEDADGNVSQVVDMGEAGKVDTLETTDAKQVEKVEVKTESFSYYTIVWQGRFGGDSVEVHYVDTNGESLDDKVDGGSSYEYGTDNNNAVTLAGSKYQADIVGYTYRYATVSTSFSSAPDSVQIDRLRLTYDDWEYKIQYRFNKNYGGTSWQDFDDDQDVYMVYEPDSSGGGSTGGGSSATGNLAHRKYVELNPDGTYDLTLNVTGAVGTEANPAEVDIVFVLDLSGSMEGSNLTAAKNAVKTLTDALIAKSSTVDSRWKLVTFSNSASIRTSNWVSASYVNSMVSSYTNNSCSGGTNYEAALTRAGSAINSSNREDATKIVVFLTDGQPTYHGTNSQGGGNYTTVADYNGALNGAAQITCDQFYAIGMDLPDDVGKDSYGRRHNDSVSAMSGEALLNDVATKVNGASTCVVRNVDNNNDLSDVFDDIAGTITTYTASNVTITDTLTAEVDQVENTNLEVKVTDANGNNVTSAEQSAGNISASYNSETKELRLDFDDNYQLKQDYTYSVTITIQPNENAQNVYINNGYTYPDIGQEDTGDTSAGKGGIFSNVEDAAKVIWTTNGTEIEGSYNRPVVQLSEENTPAKPPETQKELSRQKYVKDNGDGTYDLTLNVSGQVGSVTEKAKVDVVLLVDVSSSMLYNYYTGNKQDYEDNNSRIRKTKESVKILTDTLKNKSETIDSQWKVVTFGKTASIQTNSWVSADDAYNTVNGISIRTGVGTNYSDGFAKVTTALTDSRADAEKIVIFLTDGEPTFYGPNGAGPGSCTTQAILDGAEEAASQISCNQFYAVGIGLGNVDIYEYSTRWNDYVDTGDNTTGTQILTDIANSVTSTGVTNPVFNTADEGVDLTDIFDNIAASITSFLCSDVTITDTLSKYAEIADENAKLEIVVKRDAGMETETSVGTGGIGTIKDGAGLTLPETDENKSAVLEATYDKENKQIKLDFPEDYKLEADMTYYVTVQIAPTIDAYEYYASQSSYPDIGDEGTDAPNNTTSSLQPGFFSNEKAEVTYTYNGEDESVEYPDPVIQVSTMTTEDAPFISVKKTFTGLTKEQVDDLKAKDSDENPNNDFIITIESEDGKKYDDLKLSDGTSSEDGLSYTWILPNYSTGTYTVTEQNAELDGYVLNTTGMGDNIIVSETDWTFTPTVTSVDISSEVDFSTEGQSILMIALREEGNYLIWTKDTLSSSQQEAIKSTINGFQNSENSILKEFFTASVNKIYFYSGDKLENGISYGGSKVQCVEGKLIFEHPRQWKNVLAGSYIMSGSKDNDISVVNTYTPNLVNIDFQKYGTTYTTSQLTAKFRLEKLITTSDGSQITGEVDGNSVKKLVTSETNDFGGLAPGVYRLTEIEAPAEYTLLSEPIYFKVQQGAVTLVSISNDNEIQDVDNVQDMYQLIIPQNEQGGYIIQIKNNSIYELPSAGGPGIYWYTLSGALLMAGAALIVYRQKRKREVLLRK